MKKIVLTLTLLIISALLLCSCSIGGIPKYKEADGFSDILATSIKVDGKELNLSLKSDFSAEKYILRVYTSKTPDFKKIINKQDFSATFIESVCEISIPYSDEDAKEDLYVKVFALLTTNDKPTNNAIGSGIYKVKNGLPQLTSFDVPAVVKELTAEEKANMVTGDPIAVENKYSGGTIAVERLGIPATTVNDGPAGVRYGTNTWHPSVSNISSSWNEELIESVGINIGNEAIEHGVDVVLGPGMNIQKNALGGRNFEYSSEDPLLSGKLMAAYVKGMQKTGTGACIKHFAANNQESSRNEVSSQVKERALREIYLKGFGIAIREAAPYTVMTSYNKINGKNTGTIRELLHDVLREEFGFRGYVMTDWGAGGSMIQKVSAENDINMEGFPSDSKEILTALKRNRISEEELDVCCTNILNIVAKIAEGTHHEETSFDPVKSAAETFVLLKNDGDTLPVKEGTEIEFLGKNAKKTIFGGAGSGAVSPNQKISFYDGLIRSGLYKEGENGNYAFVFVSRETEEGEDVKAGAGGFLLTDEEFQIIEEASEKYHAKGGKVIVILNTGNPIEIMSWRDKADAILWAGYPGGGAGNALGAVVSGKYSPSGKLTITWPTSIESTPAFRYFPGTVDDAFYYEDIYVGYRYYETFNVPVAYEFGYGLTYSKFEYSDFSAKLSDNGQIELSVNVKNTGRADAAEIAEFYVSKPETNYEQPKTELVGYAKTSVLKPGETQKLSVSVLKNDFMTYDTEKEAWVLEAGNYKFSVGASVKDIKAEASLEIKDGTEILTGNKFPVKVNFETISKENYIVPESKTGENIAVGKKIIANHSESDEKSAEMAIDGDILSRWSGFGCSEEKHRLTLDLGEIYEIDKVSIRFQALSSYFEISVSDDGETFEKVERISKNNSADDILFDGTKTRFIRIEAPTGGYFAIYELEVYKK